MPSTSPLLALPYLQPAQAQKHVTHNEALQVLDAVVQLRVQGWGVTLPPVSPAAGDVWEVGAGATGGWAGQGGRLALWDGTGWQFLTPREGWRAWDQAGQSLRVHAGGSSRPLVASLQNMEGLGIGAAWDSSTRLAVASEGSLLTHRGSGHQLRVNKAAAPDTASLLFQSNWTGHAELGLAGGLDFSLKVSDGAAWTSALTVARATGVVTLPAGAVINGPLKGTAVQAGPVDSTAGRLLTAGAFGLGGPLPAIANAGVTDGTIVPGLYAYDTTAGSSGGPASVTRGTLLHSQRGAALGETQILVVEAGSTAGVYAGLVFGRSRSGGTWSAWACGSVQDSSTGTNGRCQKQQDGTQTCWHTLTTSTTAEAIWTFPQAFASSTGLIVTMGVNGTALTALSARHTAKSATSVSLSVVNTSGVRVAATLDVMAVGRWY